MKHFKNIFQINTSFILIILSFIWEWGSYSRNIHFRINFENEPNVFFKKKAFPFIKDKFSRLTDLFDTQICTFVYSYFFKKILSEGWGIVASKSFDLFNVKWMRLWMCINHGQNNGVGWCRKSTWTKENFTENCKNFFFQIRHLRKCWYFYTPFRYISVTYNF